MKLSITYKKAIMPDNIVQHYGEFDDPSAISVIIEQLCRKRDISNGDKIVIDISEVEELVNQNNN